MVSLGRHQHVCYAHALGGLTIIPMSQRAPEFLQVTYSASMLPTCMSWLVTTLDAVVSHWTFQEALCIGDYIKCM